jgi:hypothetical protein
MPPIERSVAVAAYCCLHGSDQTCQQPAADPPTAGAEDSRRAHRGHRAAVLRWEPRAFARQVCGHAARKHGRSDSRSKLPLEDEHVFAYCLGHGQLPLPHLPIRTAPRHTAPRRIGRRARTRPAALMRPSEDFVAAPEYVGWHGPDSTSGGASRTGDQRIAGDTRRLFPATPRVFLARASNQIFVIA